MADPKTPDLRVRIDGRVHELRLGDITPALAMEVRKSTGMPLSTFLQSPRDPDSLGVFVWLARRMGGEIRLTLDRVFAEVTMDKLQAGWEELEAEGEAESAPPTREGDENSALQDVAADPETPGDDS